MREIKFRAWDESTKTMHNVKGFNKLDIFTDTWDGGSSYEVLLRYRSEKVEYIPAILLQFTGLKDKNGVEIYEGDILGVSKDSKILYKNQGNLQIVYIKNTMSFELRDNSGELHRFINDYLRHLEVIGNIYENPELLEETK